MSEQIDIEQAFDELSKQHAELLFAFHGFAALVSGHITNGALFDRETLADEYEHLAEEAARRMAGAANVAPIEIRISRCLLTPLGTWASQ